MNTGKLIFTELIQVFTTSGIPTGVVKPNTPGDPDYILPITDLVSCPIAAPTTTTTTTSTTTLAPITCIAPVLVNLEMVGAGNLYRVNFETGGDNLTAVTIQYSLDGVTWINTTGGIISPRIITFPSSGLWTVRLISQCGGDGISTVSNSLGVYVKMSDVPNRRDIYINSDELEVSELDPNTFTTIISMNGTIVEGDIIEVQLTSLSPQGTTLIIDLVEYNIPSFGFLSVPITNTTAHILGVGVPIQISLPPNTDPDSYVQLLLVRLNGTYTNFGPPNALYLRTDFEGVVEAYTN